MQPGQGCGVCPPVSVFGIIEIQRTVAKMSQEKLLFCKYFFPVVADSFCSIPPGNFKSALSSVNS